MFTFMCLADILIERVSSF